MDALYFRDHVTDLDEAQTLAHVLKFIPHRTSSDVLATSLIDRFGSLSSVMNARPEQLRTVDGIGEKTAEYIASLLGVVRAWSFAQSDNSEPIRNRPQAEKVCKALVAGARVEEAWILALNAQCKLIGKRRISTGNLSEVSIYPRIIAETALAYNAHSVILCHNHPGGTCAPSYADIQSTQLVQNALKALGVLVLDHIIVAGDCAYSMAQHGDITNK